MRKERRVYKIPVGHFEDKDVKNFMNDIVTKFKSKIIMEPGIIYAPYIPMNTDAIIEGYFPKGKILKIKEWLRLQRYGQKTINNNFYRTISVGDNNIPEVNLKMESRTVVGGTLKKIGTEWKVVAGEKIRQSLELTEDELAFNKISKEIKKRGI